MMVPTGTLRRQARRHNYSVRRVPSSPTSPTSPEQVSCGTPLRAARPRIHRAVRINESDLERFERQIRRMAAVDPMVDGPTQDAVEWVREGTKALDLHRLKEAHSFYTKAMRLLGVEPSPCQLKLRLRVQALTGLARLHVTRARGVKADARAWLYQFIQAYYYEKLALQQSECALARSNIDPQTEMFILEHRDKSRGTLREVAKQLAAALEVHLVYQRPVSRVQRDVLETITVSNEAWLRDLETYMSGKARCGNALLLELDKVPASAAAPTAPAAEPILVKQTKPQSSGKLKMKQVKRVVERLKQRLTDDLHLRQNQRNVLRHMKASDTLNSKISPLAFSTSLSESNVDIQALFESALLQDREEYPPELESLLEEEDRDLADLDEEVNDLEETQENGQEQEDHPTANGTIEENEVTHDDVIRNGPPSPLQLPPPSPTDSSCVPESPFSDVSSATSWMSGSEFQYPQQKETQSPSKPVNLFVDNEDPFVAPDILELWRNNKTYSEEQPPKKARKVFEHVSKESQELNSLYTEAADYMATHGPYEPLNSDSLRCALAESLAQLADRLRSRGKEDMALTCYTLAMDVALRADPHDLHLRVSLAQLMCRAASLRAARKDIKPADALLQEAIKTLDELNRPDMTSREMAAAWCQLGDIHLRTFCQKEDLADRVMLVVQDELRQEALREQGLLSPQSPPGGGPREQDEEDTHSALEAYTNALELLRTKHVTDDDSLRLEALSRIADLSVLVGDYEKALVHYEHCLNCFSKAKSSQDCSAHVLAMLGVTHYLLGGYPKAVAMLECANWLHEGVAQDGAARTAQSISRAAKDIRAEQAFTLSVLGSTCSLLQQHHKAVKWSSKAFDLYQSVHKDRLTSLEHRPAWFVTHTLYVLGQSYLQVGCNDKALQFLELAQTLCEGQEQKDTKQLIRVLKATADVHTAKGDEENAQKFYERAISLSHNLGDEKSATTIQNQLYNRMAGVHVTNKDYSMASKYLDHALGHQKNVEQSIKTDMFGVLSQLGYTYTVAGDVTKAVDCFEECIESQGDIKRSELTPEERTRLAEVFLCLATLYHVQSVLEDDSAQVQRQLERAEQLYMRAVTFHHDGPAVVMYANFLFHEDRYGEAVQVLAPRMRAARRAGALEYHGVAQAVLPAHLHPELEQVDKVHLHSDSFARFIGMLCYRRLSRTRDTQDCLDALYRNVQAAKPEEQDDVTQEMDRLDRAMLACAVIECGLADDAQLDSLEDAKTTLSLTYRKWSFDVSGRTARAALEASGKNRPERARARLFVSEEVSLPNSVISTPNPSQPTTPLTRTPSTEPLSPWQRRTRKESPERTPTLTSNNSTIEAHTQVASIASQHKGRDNERMITRDSDANKPVKQVISREKSWTEEETVDTPLELLNLLKAKDREGSQEPHVTSNDRQVPNNVQESVRDSRDQQVPSGPERRRFITRPPDLKLKIPPRPHDITQDKQAANTPPVVQKTSSPQDETWTVVEETIDAPKEILMHIKNTENEKRSRERLPNSSGVSRVKDTNLYINTDSGQKLTNGHYDVTTPVSKSHHIDITPVSTPYTSTPAASRHTRSSMSPMTSPIQAIGQHQNDTIIAKHEASLSPVHTPNSTKRTTVITNIPTSPRTPTSMPLSVNTSNSTPSYTHRVIPATPLSPPVAVATDSYSARSRGRSREHLVSPLSPPGGQPVHHQAAMLPTGGATRATQRDARAISQSDTHTHTGSRAEPQSSAPWRRTRTDSDRQERARPQSSVVTAAVPSQEEEMDEEKERLRVMQALREARARDKSPRMARGHVTLLSPTEGAGGEPWESPEPSRRTRPVVRRPTLRAEPHGAESETDGGEDPDFRSGHHGNARQYGGDTNGEHGYRFKQDDVKRSSQYGSDYQSAAGGVGAGGQTTEPAQPYQSRYQQRYFSGRDQAAGSGTADSRFSRDPHGDAHAQRSARVQRAQTFASGSSRPRMGAGRRNLEGRY